MAPSTTTLPSGSAAASGVSDAIAYVIAHPELIPTGLTITAIGTAVALGWTKIKHIIKNLEGLGDMDTNAAADSDRLSAIEKSVEDIKKVVNRELRPNGGESMRDRVIRTEERVRALKDDVKSLYH